MNDYFKNNKTIIILWFLVLFIILFFIIMYFYMNNNKKIDLYNSNITQKLDLFEEYSHNWYDTSFYNRDIKTDEIIDFYIDYNNDISKEDSEVELLFSNTKLSFLANSIFYWDNNIEKLYYLDFINAYSSVIWYDFISYSNEKKYIINDLLLYENNIYNFDIDNLDLLLDKYFVFRYLHKHNIVDTSIVVNKFKTDIYDNFENISIDNQLLFLFYLSLISNDDLKDFLSYKDLVIDKLYEIDNLSDSNKIKYLYVLSINWINYDYDFSYLLEKFNEFDYITKLFFVSLLSSYDLDYEEQYNYIENNYLYIDLDNRSKFLKFLLYKNNFEDYSSYDTYSKFWYSLWYVVNRKIEYEVWVNGITYYYADYPISRLEYNNEIDARIASFEWEKFYLQITVKQK